MSDILISIVSPVYRAEKIIPELVRRIHESVSTITANYEIILVEDCGPDNSWSAIEIECEKDSKIKGIKLSRNFGQHYAITAGLTHAKGEWIVVMDCDLQDRPEEIPALYQKAQEGFDVVFAQRVDRKDSFIKKITSDFFYKTLSYLTESKFDSSIANFGIFNRKVILEVIAFKEQNFVFPIIIRWLGFNSTQIHILHNERAEGESSYNFKKRLKLAVEIILCNTDKPIRLFMKTGMIISFTSLIYSLYILYMYNIGEIKQAGYTSIMISIWFLSGFLLTAISLSGLYIGKIFDGVKDRPKYVLNKKINL